MLPDRVPNPGPLTYESGALPIALRGPALTVIDYPQNKTLRWLMNNLCILKTKRGSM